MTCLTIDTPRWAKPLLKPARYRAAHGGRGSGKSHFFAEMVIEAHVIDQNRRTVCVREIQKSLSQSVKRLLEMKIEQLGVQQYFKIQDTAIKELNAMHGYREPQEISLQGNLDVIQRRIIDDVSDD